MIVSGEIGPKRHGELKMYLLVNDSVQGPVEKRTMSRHRSVEAALKNGKAVNARIPGNGYLDLNVYAKLGDGYRRLKIQRDEDSRIIGWVFA